MSSVSIFDLISFQLRSDTDIQLTIESTCQGSAPSETDTIPTDRSNLIVRAIELVRDCARSESKSSCEYGFDIHLRKHIPSAAGLGGASSNCAAALVAANKMWNLNWTTSKLSELASQLGSDIPFFLTGGTAVCRGRGEKVETLRVAAGLPIVIAKPPVALSTASVFSNVSIATDLASSQKLITSYLSGDIRRLGKCMFNRMQEFAEPLTRQIAHLRQSFVNIGSCLGHQMSGSGSSYFGVFANVRSARQAMTRLSARHPEVRIFSSQTLSPHHL